MFLAKLLSRNEVEVPEGLFGEEYNPTKITKREVQFKKKEKKKEQWQNHTKNSTFNNFVYFSLNPALRIQVNKEVSRFSLQNDDLLQ